VVQFLDPSYSLYPVLATIHDAEAAPVPLLPNFDLPSLKQLKKDGLWNFQAALTFLTTPNAPSGQGYSTASLDALCKAQKGVLLLDETYADFAEENAMELAMKYRHVLVARTFSKAYALCFQRVGYAVGHVKLIAAMQKIRDSYNVNGLGQVAALATMDHRDYYVKQFARIKETRAFLTQALTDLGFAVHPSQTNFIFARPPVHPAEEWLTKLRERKILVRWFRIPAIQDYLRISIGTEQETQALLRAVKNILKTR
jgi:histidinol-phosphate aminotransferase